MAGFDRVGGGGGTDPQTAINTGDIATNTSNLAKTNTAITIPFDSFDARVFSELGLPNLQGWTQTGTLALVSDNIYGVVKDSIRITTTDGGTQRPMTPAEWGEILIKGGSYSFDMRIFDRNLDSSLLAGLGFSAANDPRVVYDPQLTPTRGRILLRLAINTTYTVIATDNNAQTTYTILDGTNGKPLVLKNEWFNATVKIHESPDAGVTFGSYDLHVNGVFLNSDTIRAAGAVEDIIAIEAWGGGDNTQFYLENFGITGYKEGASKLLTLDQMAFNDITCTTPNGIRDYEVITPDGAGRNIGDTIKLIAKNVYGTNTIRTENLVIPQALFNGENSFTVLTEFESEMLFTNLVDNGNIYQGTLPVHDTHQLKDKLLTLPKFADGTPTKILQYDALGRPIEVDIARDYSRLHSYLPIANPYTTPVFAVDTATKVTIPNQQTKTVKEFTFDAPNARWKFDKVGASNVWFSFSLTATVIVGNPLTVVTIDLYKNGVMLEGLGTSLKLANASEEGNMGMTGVMQLSHDDYLEGFITLSTATTLTIKRFVLAIDEMVGAV